MGGGLCEFLPIQDEFSCRADNWNGIAEAKDKGYSVVLSIQDFDKLTPDEARYVLLVFKKFEKSSFWF